MLMIDRHCWQFCHRKQSFNKCRLSKWSVCKQFESLEPDDEIGPQFDIYSPYQIDLNQTGGTEIPFDTGIGDQNSTIYVEPGLKNRFTLSNAYTWEGGRGYRCDFWRSVGSIVPE